MPKSYKPYVLGTHSAKIMVPKFWNSKTCHSTITAVKIALRKSGHYAAMPKEHRMGLAAYIWYQRRNRYAGKFSNGKGYDQYKAIGVYPVRPDILSIVRMATILKYTDLVYGDQK